MLEIWLVTRIYVARSCEANEEHRGVEDVFDMALYMLRKVLVVVIIKSETHFVVIPPSLNITS